MTGVQRLLWMSSISFSLTIGARGAIATTHTEGSATCPIDGTKVPTVEIMSTNSFGGRDRDLMVRANGDQPFMLTTVTCPKCHYSGTPDRFDALTLTEAVLKAAKDGALQPPKLPHLGPRTPAATPDNPSGLPAWARLALSAQVSALRRDPAAEQAFGYAEVSWALRLEENPFVPPNRDPPPSVAKLEPERKKDFSQNQADLDVTWARAIVKNLGSLPSADRRDAALLSGYLLRTHGEHVDLLAALPALLAQLKPAERGELERKAKASIELERSFQRLSIARLKDAALVGNDKNHDIYEYLIGELSRRVGDMETARAHLKGVANSASASPDIKRIASEQLALLSQ